MFSKRLVPDLDRSAAAAYFAEQQDIILVYLFGSMARGQADRFSDIDIAVLLDDKSSVEQFLARQLEIMGEMEKAARGEVQIVLLNQATPLLAFQVVRDGKLLHQRSRAERIAFEVGAMRQYADIKPMLDFFNREMLKRIEEDGLGRRKRNSERTLETARRVHERLERAAKR